MSMVQILRNIDENNKDNLIIALVGAAATVISHAEKPTAATKIIEAIANRFGLLDEYRKECEQWERKQMQERRQ